MSHAGYCDACVMQVFWEKLVLRNVSGTLAAGRITGLMAPSGAGKTTLLRILMGLEQADSGRIDGLDGLRLSAVFQEDRLCDQLDGVSNLRLVTPSLSRTEARNEFRRWDLPTASVSPPGSFPEDSGAEWRFPWSAG